MRNRIISALSVATVVVEADVNSGSLITARYAKEQGKDLFAFPGPVSWHSYKGTNKLIKEGATVATEAIDILEQYMDAFPLINLSASKERPILNKPQRVASNSVDKDKFYADLNTNGKSDLKNSNGTCNQTNSFDASTLNGNELLVYNSMEFGKAVSIEDFSKIEIDVSELASAITMLEIKGAIESAPGGFYIKK